MTFTIDNDNNITAFGSAEEATAATATPFDSFASQKELAGLVAGWPAERLVAIWNGLPGVEPVKKFKNSQAAASRIWKRIQTLGAPEQPQPKQPLKAKPERKAKGGARAAKGTSSKGKLAKKTTAKTRPRGGKKKPRAPGRAKAARRPRLSRCSSGRTAPRWPRSWTRWAGRSTRCAASWPAR